MAAYETDVDALRNDTCVYLGPADVQSRERHCRGEALRVLHVYLGDMQSNVQERRAHLATWRCGTDVFRRGDGSPEYSKVHNRLIVLWESIHYHALRHMKQVKTRCDNERVCDEQRDANLHAVYLEKIKQLEAVLVSVSTDIREAIDARDVSRQRQQKRQRSNVMCELPFRARELKQTDDVDFRIDALLEASRSMHSRIDMAKYRDSRGLYKNIVVTNSGRYTWGYKHAQHTYKSRLSFRTLEEAVMSLMDARTSSHAHSLGVCMTTFD